MSISKKTREKVYQKYNGHCAYCGREIELRDMQVDHFIPQEMEPVVVAGNFPGIDSIDDFQNLMPACRMCNHYKRAHSLNTFRRYIEEIPKKLRNDYIYKIGVAYGNIVENEKPIRFFFELDPCEKCIWRGDGEEVEDTNWCYMHAKVVRLDDRCFDGQARPEEDSPIITKASPASSGIHERRENPDA